MNYSNAARGAGVAAIVALANGGTLRLRAGSTTRCNITLAATAFDVSGVTATARGGNGSAAIGGGNPLTGTGESGATAEVDNYQVLNSSSAVVWDGDADELALVNYSIAAGQPVQITGWTHQLPAS
jgi:hypothetical protein